MTAKTLLNLLSLRLCPLEFGGLEGRDLVAAREGEGLRGGLGLTGG